MADFTNTDEETDDTMRDLSLKARHNIITLHKSFLKLKEEPSLYQEHEVGQSLVAIKSDTANWALVQQLVWTLNEFTLLLPEIITYKMEEKNCRIRRLGLQIVEMYSRHESNLESVWKELGKFMLRLLQEHQISEIDILLNAIYNIYKRKGIINKAEKLDIISSLTMMKCLPSFSHNYFHESYYEMIMDFILLEDEEMANLWKDLDLICQSSFLSYVSFYLGRGICNDLIPFALVITFRDELHVSIHTIINDNTIPNVAHPHVDLYFLLNLISDLSHVEKYLPLLENNLFFIDMCHMLKYLMQNERKSRNVFNLPENLRHLAPDHIHLMWEAELNLIEYIQNLTSENTWCQMLASGVHAVVDIYDCRSLYIENLYLKLMCENLMRTLLQFENNVEILLNVRKMSSIFLDELYPRIRND